MTAKVAGIIFQGERIIFECPFCGRTLIKSNYEKCSKLLDETDAPRGKVCKQCGHTVILKLDDHARRKIASRTGPVARIDRGE